MTIFHMQPSATTDWEGEYQVDDRPGMLFKGNGGILDHIDVYLGTDQGATTDGVYFVRVYEGRGSGIDPVPDTWAASTVYSQGDLVRSTSVANAEVHYAYRCTVGGTSGGTEPTWPSYSTSWQDNSDGDTLSDNTVTWEVVWTGYPTSPALPANTPTPDWLAESDHVTYAPGSNQSATWKTLDFTGSDRIRLQKDAWYMVIVQWWANSSSINNLITVEGGHNANADHEGVCYLDGSSSNNNGPRIIEDLYFRLYEFKTTLDKVSGTDAGFANTVTPADTDPFNEGEKADYDVQAGDALDFGDYYWRVRAKDPTDTDTYSSWTTTRTFDVSADIVVTPPVGYAILTGYVPTITISNNIVIEVPVGTLTLTGYAPTVTVAADVDITVPVGTLTLTGYAPTVTATEHVNIEVPIGNLVLTGYAPTVALTQSADITVPVGTLTLTGYAPTVTTITGLEVQVSAGVYYTDVRNRFVVPNISSADVPLSRWFRSSGVWTSDSNAAVDTTQYDDGTDLTNYTANYWAKGLLLVSTAEILFVYPQAEYSTWAAANTADAPTIPSDLVNFPKSVTIVFQQGDTDFSQATFTDVRPMLDRLIQ